MKHFILCCILFAVSVTVAMAGNSTMSAPPQITFVVTEHDFGKILESDKKVSFEFEFENTGSTPLVITRIITSCKCVDVNYSKRPISPQSTGKIIVTYNPRKQRGIFYKALQIYTNCEQEREIIVIKGEVIEQ